MTIPPVSFLHFYEARLLITPGDTLSLWVIEEERHEAFLARLRLLKEHALGVEPPLKKARLDTQVEILMPPSGEHTPVLDQLVSKVGIGQGLPCVKVMASRLAFRLLRRVIIDMKNKGQGTRPMHS